MSRSSRENAELEEAKAHITRLELFLADRTTYSVIVFTGSQKGANTTAQAYLNMLGVAGASGERPLLGGSHLLGAGPVFRRGAAAKFTIESHYLGHLTSLLIGHDNSGCGNENPQDKVDPQ